MDPVGPAGFWGAYIGKAPAGVKTRLATHLGARDHWHRAILVRRDTKFGFNSAQVAWLEGRFYELLHSAKNAELHNKVRPVDETLQPHDGQMLKSCVMPITRVLRLVGYAPAAVGEVTNAERSAPRLGTKKKVSGTVKDLLDAGLLEPNAKLVCANSTMAWPGHSAARWTD